MPIGRAPGSTRTARALVGAAAALQVDYPSGRRVCDHRNPVNLVSEQSEQFIIEVGSKYQAECVARELEDFSSDLQHRDGKWVIAVAQPELLELPTLLASLDKCLHDNEISSVRVVIGERSYVMEPAAG